MSEDAIGLLNETGQPGVQDGLEAELRVEVLGVLRDGQQGRGNFPLIWEHFARTDRYLER